MKRSFLLVVLGLWTTACGPKLHEYVNNIDSINVRAEREPLSPHVELGKLEVDQNNDGEVTGKEHAAKNTNQNVRVFEEAFEQRLDAGVRQQQLITDVARTIRQNVEKNGGPFPLNPQAQWRLVSTISHWGVSTGFSGAADSYITIRTDLWSPQDERAWTHYEKCYRDLAPDRFSDRGQIQMNIHALGAISDKQIKNTFTELAIECGRKISNELRADVAKARQKANKD